MIFHMLHFCSLNYQKDVSLVCRPWTVSRQLLFDNHATVLKCASANLQAPREELQQQEVSASSGQEQHASRTGGAETHVKQSLIGRLPRPQVDVSIPVEWDYNNEQRRQGRSRGFSCQGPDLFYAFISFISVY